MSRRSAFRVGILWLVIGPGVVLGAPTPPPSPPPPVERSAVATPITPSSPPDASSAPQNLSAALPTSVASPIPDAAAAAPTSQATTVALTSMEPDAPTTATISAPLPLDAATAKKEFDRVVEAVNRARPPWWQTALPGVLTAVLVGLFGFLGNRKLQERAHSFESSAASGRHEFELRLAKQKAGLDATKELIAWRVRQMEQLYGPLRALLGQSKAVTDLLHQQLHDALPEGERDTRWVDDPKSTSGQSFQILDENGVWKPFRLLEQLPALYAKPRTHIGPLVAEILNIGEQMVKIIRERAGLMLSNQKDLADVFAKYLAHFAFLKECDTACRDEKTRNQAQHYTTGFYPREINKLVEAGFLQLNGELTQWQDDLAKLAAEISLSRPK